MASMRPPLGTFRSVESLVNVCLPQSGQDKQYTIRLSGGRIESVTRCTKQEVEALEADFNAEGIDGCGALIAPSLCHPHIHLDKAFLLAYPKFSHLRIEKGTFDEAMELTNKAKVHFEEDDLLERGQHLVDESVRAGVTHMRAFVEVDPIVNLKCLVAGRDIRVVNAMARRCHVQLCAFAQLPLFTGKDGGEEIRRLMIEACESEYMAEAIGSTPYVEGDRANMEMNVRWLIDLALKEDKHLDFHLDYNLDPSTEPLVWFVIQTLKDKEWTAKSKNTVVLGHCTRLTLFKDAEWRRLRTEIGDLPISFVGLPTSDLYMMKTDHGARGTLPVPKLIKEYGLNAAIGLNNIGNAFTPQGCCDPLHLANLGVGVYQAGTERDTEILYECVSTRAKAAIGIHEAHENPSRLEISEGQVADFVLFPDDALRWKKKKTISDAVYFYDGRANRIGVHQGRTAP